MNIIEMAREAGFAERDSMFRVVFVANKYDLEKFAALVAAQEREECAKECERMMMYPNAKQESAAHQDVWAAAKAIRARGTT